MCQRAHTWILLRTQEMPTSGRILIVILKLANGPVHHHESIGRQMQPVITQLAETSQIQHWSHSSLGLQSDQASN